MARCWWSWEGAGRTGLLTKSSAVRSRAAGGEPLPRLSVADTRGVCAVSPGDQKVLKRRVFLLCPARERRSRCSALVRVAAWRGAGGSPG